jgi:hypothetical protein
LALPRATRFETTTRFTGPLLLVRMCSTSIHQYGSFEFFDELTLNSDRAERNRFGKRKRKQLMQEKHALP